MKAAWIADAARGDLSIVVGETADPDAGSRGLIVAVEAVGLTFGEPHWVTNGAGPLPDGRPRPLPVIIGHEFAGRVVDAAAGDHDFTVGDRVFGLIDFWRNGAAAELAHVLPSEIARVPEGISAVDAATLPIGALTAWQGLFDHGHLQAGQTVLIHGGAGAVGTFAIQIAKGAKARVIATARGAESVALCRSLGADVVVDTAAERFEAVAGGVDLVFDTVGRDLLERSWAIVPRGGTLVTISGEAEDAPSPERARELGVSAAWFIVSPDPGQLAQLASWVLDGRIRVKLDAVYPLDDARRVFQEAAGRAHAGKTVLKI
ncbi:NADP-dependent oxidoreductase [Luteibacter aegosomatissinici]|uniref:NADP-dependent oxidoreductase n=1 Tax=Luteibacter aegosomatissinici TaxID=2911539 RepID=UPI001FFACAE7|nr:NADP-dependent oxidoreductase [Luteibacter aegosomatissinici]UPG92573.1 NADP-dependent oxidoreductase [Luteibacter aegosomatissinici]